MGASLIQPCRVREETDVSRVTVPEEAGPANYVPAAAVIRRVQALIGITGRKACVDGYLSRV